MGTLSQQCLPSTYHTPLTGRNWIHNTTAGTDVSDASGHTIFMMTSLASSMMAARGSARGPSPFRQAAKTMLNMMTPRYWEVPAAFTMLVGKKLRPMLSRDSTVAEFALGAELGAGVLHVHTDV